MIEETIAEIKFCLDLTERPWFEFEFNHRLRIKNESLFDQRG